EATPATRSAASNNWLVLSPKMRDSGAFGRAWAELDAKYIAVAGEPLGDKLVQMLATASDVGIESASVYIDNYCHDFRMRGFQGGRVFSSSFRCTQQFDAF